MGSLYHYTKLETFLKFILPTQKLRASYLDLTNDPREALPWSFGSTNLPFEKLFPDYYSNETHIECQFKFGELIKSRMQVICFSGAKEKGWNNEMMWAHYGESHQGICLELDEDILIENIRQQYPLISFVLSPISYNKKKGKKDKWIDWDDKNDIEFNITQNIERLHPLLALTKSPFWEKEDEKRLVIFNEMNQVFVSLRGALKAVHFGLKFKIELAPQIGRALLLKNIVPYRLIYQRERYERWDLGEMDLDKIDSILKNHL